MIIVVVVIVVVVVVIAVTRFESVIILKKKAFFSSLPFFSSLLLLLFLLLYIPIQYCKSFQSNWTVYAKIEEVIQHRYVPTYPYSIFSIKRSAHKFVNVVDLDKGHDMYVYPCVCVKERFS